MNRCPVEIYAHIFQLACMDGGYTGRALSLVSKYFHDVSKPLKYYSVSCHGFWQAIEFLRLIKTLPPCDRIVHYLSVTDAYPYHIYNVHPDSESGRTGRFNGLFEVDTDWDSAKTWERRRYLEELQTTPSCNIRRTVASLFTYFPDEARRCQSEARRQEIIDAELEPDISCATNPEGLRRVCLPLLMADAVYGILEMVAPNILSFSSSGEHTRYSPEAIAHIYFPKLVELTLSYDWPWSATCPSLRRLNLLGDASMCPLRRRLPIVAPMITHFCVNASGYGSRRMIVEALKSLGMGQPRSDREEKGVISQHLPASVKQIILVLEPKVEAYHQETEKHHINNILALTEHDERIICLSRPQPAYLGLERWWIERMNGGEGCWNMEGKIGPC